MGPGTGNKEVEEECLCYAGAGAVHQANTVCFVIKEESEPSAGSVHSCHEHVEETVKYDLKLKCNKKVKLIKKLESAREEKTKMCGDQQGKCERIELRVRKRVAEDNDPSVDDMKEDDGDSGTESVAEDSFIIKKKIISQGRKHSSII